jgi:hypothetical protein
VAGGVKLEWSPRALSILPTLVIEGKTTLPLGVQVVGYKLDAGTNLNSLKDNDLIVVLDFGPRTAAELAAIKKEFKLP